MKTVADRIRRSFVVSAVSLSIISLAASCTFGLTPATLNRSSATVSIAFPSGTMPPTKSPSPRAGSGDSRAVAPGANWLYLRAGEGDDSFETYGPYEVGSGTFTTKDIPAGTYDYLAILLVSESIPAKTELSVDGTAITFARALSLPDERFFALLSDGTLSAFFDARFCVASGYVVKPCKIASGKNVISATLVPLTSRTATMSSEPSSASFSCPTNDSGSLRPVYFKVGALAYPEGSASPSVVVTICPAKTESWARVGSVLLYDETGSRLGALDVNGMLTVDKDKPESAVRTVTVGNPTRGALYVYVSYENALNVILTPVLAAAPPPDEVGTYVSSTGKAGAAGTRADPQSFAYAVNNGSLSPILLLGDVETNATLSVARTLTIRPALGVTSPRIKAASGFTDSYISVASGGNLTLQGVYLEGNASAKYPLLMVEGGSTTLTGGAVIDGSTPVVRVAFVFSGTLILDGATIKKGFSTKGGGVYVTSTGTLVVKGSSAIRDCVASQLGGGVYAENGGIVDISAAGASSITSNSAQRGGGGVFLCESATLTEGSGSWVTSVSGNDTEYALPNLARRVPVSTDTAMINALQDSSIPRYIDVLGNIAQSISVAVAGECSLSSTTSFAISRASGFTSGALFDIPSGASLSVGGSLTVEGLGYMVDVDGPLVRVTGGKFSVRDSAMLIGNKNICSATATSDLGGAVNVNGGTFVMYGGSLGMMDSGANVSPLGGNVYVRNGSFILRGGYVRYGTATDSSTESGGGGVFIDGNAGFSSFEMPVGSTGSISANGSVHSGGGLALYGPQATATLAGGYIGGETSSDGNAANAYEGGGVYLNNQSKATLSGTKIMNNSAMKNGGGIYVQSTARLTIDTALTTTLVTQNTATTGSGGGLFMAFSGCCSASSALKNTVINGNTASTDPDWNTP